ncbi:SRPBCC family protein [Streptomyces cavernae]|uniref:SRPBCC family protein n=1 Tax=Streptomyces cavernae TaxID=2259034 RepID=UPI000FEBA257|nr:SRPBCC family protein [Streptomyces cavernae]
MTDTLKGATDTAKGATGTLGGFAKSEAADRLKAEVQDYLAAQAQRALVGFGHKLGETTGKLNDIAEGKSPGFAKLALNTGRKLAEGKGPLRTAVEVGAGRAKDSVITAFKGLGSKGKKGKGKSTGSKPTVILEYVDVGVDVRTAYDQWTQFESFSTFAKGIKNAQRADDTSSDWTAKIFLSTRSWKGRTTEQVPDERIAWTTEGDKGTTKGVVSFHALADRLTRVLLIMEYYPQGFFEKTGNIWRAQGRRARLDLKNFARFITMRGEATDAWRGEIRDGDVVRSHEDAVAEEEEEREPEDEYEGSEENEEPEDEYEDTSEEPEEGEGARYEDDEAYPEDEEAYEDEDEEPTAEEEEEEEEEEEPVESRSR